MKNLLLGCLTLLICFSCFSFSVKKKNRNLIFSGTLYEQHTYCGGAAPSPDQLHPKPYPLAGAKLYLRKGQSNNTDTPVIDSITTNEKGEFSISLPKGIYCIVESTKRDKPVVPRNDNYNNWDSACYVKQHLSCDYSLQLTKPVSGASIILQRHCPWSQPCLDYHGPLPPAAHPGNNKPPHQE